MNPMQEMLLAADEAQRKHKREAELVHLPDTFEDGVDWWRDLIEQRHEATVRGDTDTIIACREEAQKLAEKLNGGTHFGTLAPDGAGNRLMSATAAPPGQVPMWGQQGRFWMEAAGCHMEIKMDGMLGLGGSLVPGFEARCVDPSKPFISDTGFRSFLGWLVDVSGRLTVEEGAALAIEHHVRTALDGKLKMVSPLHGGPETTLT